MSKYGNRKVETPDGTFDSVKEFSRWQELKLLQRAGEIHDLQRQVPFVLIPTQKDERGKVVERELKYIADFVYLANDGTGWCRVVEDVKGMKTEVYRIKKKLMLYRNGIRIQEV